MNIEALYRAYVTFNVYKEKRKHLPEVRRMIRGRFGTKVLNELDVRLSTEQFLAKQRADAGH